MRAIIRSTVSAHVRRLLIAMVALMALATTSAWALLSSDYQFTASNATYTPIAGASVAIAGTNQNVPGGGQFNDTASAGPFNIGFAFRFDCLSYTQFSVSTSGTLYLGSLKSGGFNNDLANAPRYPIIAPWWDHQHLYNNGGAANGCTFTPTEGIRYVLTGTAPNRVLTVEFNTQVADVGNNLWWAGCGLTMNRYQVALYEGTNVIQFRYSSLWASSGQPTAATIGIGNGTTNFLSVTPTGGTATVSSVTSNNAIAQHVALIPSGTVYTFTPCYFNLIGTAGQATPSMAPGDSILNTQTVMVGNEGTFTPFNITFPAGACPSHNYTITISGPNATEYRWLSTGNQVVAGSLSAGSSISYTMAFRPSTVGVRPAFLTFTDNTIGCSTIYNLAGIGGPRLTVTGDISQGAQTVPSPTGDTLFKNLFVTPGVVASRTPLTFGNGATGGFAGAMGVTYTITGGSGQYAIVPGNASLNQGQTNTPTITFTPAPNARGVQQASLAVTADGVTRTYVLYMTIAAPEFVFKTGTTTLDNTSTLFVNNYGCLGEQFFSYPIDISNPNLVADTIWSVDVYQVDSVFSQGSPRYPLLRDQLGNPIKMQDYVLSVVPPTTPVQANTPLTYPYRIAPGQTVRVWLTFVGQRRNKRFGRIFIRTNGFNISAPNESNVVTQGLLTMDLFARGVGSVLSDQPSGGLPKAITFPVTPLGETSEQTFTLYNTGQCDLRISLERMEIVAGDVDEFTLTEKPTGTTDSRGNLVLTPGSSVSGKVRFAPTQVDSRRARLRLVTNDSMIVINGITERGVYYLDLFGTGKSDLYADGADLGVALIGGGAEEHKHGVVRLRNTLNGPMIVRKVLLGGVDVADFGPDPLKPWPTRFPVVIQGGQNLELGVVFAPAGGTPGPREAEVQIILDNGDTLVAKVTGIAGTRLIAVAPVSVNFAVSVGKQARQMVSITNTGTMDLKLTKVSLGNPDFTMGTLARQVLSPGQVEYIEITFTPQGPGTSSDALTVESNGTNGSQSVTLNGTSFRTRRGVDDPSGSTVADPGVGLGSRNGVVEFSISGVSGVRDASGMSLLQSVPNPGRDLVEIGWELVSRGDMSLRLYDGTGRMVRELASGLKDAGTGRVRVDVSGLPSGLYHYRLQSGGRMLERTLTVVH